MHTSQLSVPSRMCWVLGVIYLYEQLQICIQVSKTFKRKTSKIRNGEERAETRCWRPMQYTSTSLVHFDVQQGNDNVQCDLCWQSTRNSVCRSGQGYCSMYMNLTHFKESFIVNAIFPYSAILQPALNAKSFSIKLSDTNLVNGSKPWIEGQR